VLQYPSKKEKKGDKINENTIHENTINGNM